MMSKRAVVLGLAGLGIPLALLVLVLPITWGYGGYLYGGPAGQTPRITYSDPDGPAYRAGLRVGDAVAPSRGMQAVAEDAGPIGTVAIIHRIEGTHVRDVSLAFVPYSGRLAMQQRINKIVNALAALAAFALAIVVVLRARDRRIGVRSATVLILAGATALVLGGALVCNNAVAGEVLYQFLPAPLKAATLWAAVALLGIFPPPVSRTRRVLPIVCAVVFLYSLYFVAARIPFLLTGVVPSWLLLFGLTTLQLAIFFGLSLPLAIACVDAMVTTDEEHAAATRWLCSLWLVSWLFDVLPFLAAFAGSRILFTHYGDVLGAGTVAFLALGIAYPILRHRLVDLNILISRATVFTIVSLIIVVLFVTVEWGASKFLEQALGVTIDRAHVPSQVLTLILVIALGLSARWIHRFVETTMMRAFFRKRLQGLAEIEACAQEVDVATDVRAIVDVAVATIVRSLDIGGCTIYVYDGSAYVRAASSGNIELPERYEFNDVAPLKLRRWRSHVELQEGSPDTLFLPMLVRGDLLGFIACGAKIDRTAFLSDEIAPLTQLAHHIGLAKATLEPAAGAKSSPNVAHRLALLGICTLGLLAYLCAPARAECTAKTGSVFFITDRQPLDNNQLFSGEWGTDANHNPVITAGVISAPVDKSHESRCSSRQAFINAVRSRFRKNKPRQVLVYVHGYYTSFVTAVETGMALQKGLHFPGPTIVYSWPARKTSVLAYKTDEANAKWSMPHFITFLGNINKAFPGMPVTLAGYSLGSRFVTDGIAFYRRAGCGNCFGRAVLFAPDVSTGDLRSALTSSNLCSGKPMPNPIAAARVLLYVSNDDKALRQSERVHGNQRAGQAGGDLILCNDVDTVDVSYLKSGHGYLTDPPVLRDTAAAFAGVPPTSRGLKQVSRAGGDYYELLPSP